MKAKKAVYPIILASVSVAYILFMLFVVIIMTMNSANEETVAFTPEVIQSMKVFCLVPTAIYVACAVACQIISFKVPYTYISNISFRKMKKYKTFSDKTIFILRVCFITLFLTLIVIGLIGGAYHSAYLKAIYICRECLGIG